MEVTDKVIVVTGGASGIGRELCHRFMEEKAKAVMVVDIDGGQAEVVAREVGGLAMACDVSKEAEIREVVKETEETCGPIDMFCSNAGIMGAGDVDADAFIPEQDIAHSYDDSPGFNFFHLVKRVIAHNTLTNHVLLFDKSPLATIAALSTIIP